MTAPLAFILAVAAAYLAAHVLFDWLARRFLIVSRAEYLVLGILLGPQVSGAGIRGLLCAGRRTDLVNRSCTAMAARAAARAAPRRRHLDWVSSRRAMEWISERQRRRPAPTSVDGALAASGRRDRLAAVVAQTYPHRGGQIRSLFLALVAINQVLGPILFRRSLERSGEIPDMLAADADSLIATSEASSASPS